MTETAVSSASEAVDAMLAARLAALGYTHLCLKPGAGVCGVMPFLFTGGLVVGMAERSYKGRYCFETLSEAAAALKSWDGVGDPPGNWIKFKSQTEDRLGPGAACD